MEGEKQTKLYEKYMCYCKTSGGELEKTIAASEAKVPEVESSIKGSVAEKAQMDEALASHKSDRSTAKRTMAEAAGIREKEAAAFAAKKAEYGADIAAIEKAVAALEQGMAGTFLQTPAANVLRSLVQSKADMIDDDRQQVASFLAAGQGSEYAPQSGQIVGILKQLSDEMAKGLVDETAAEEAAIKSYEELMAAKKKEVAALSASIEDKTARSGELAVSIVTLKDELADTEAALIEDKKFLADLSKHCDTKTSEWGDIVKTRNEELAALAETIRILSDDDALELFKKTLPSAAASFVQIHARASSIRARALVAIRRAQMTSRMSRPQLDFISLALRGKEQGFEKVIAMIDDMIGILKKEQEDDNSKKEYCAEEFDSSDDKKKGLERAVSDSESAIAVAEEGIAALAEEIKALEAGIAALDKSVASATEMRKNEHEDFVELMAEDSAAKKLLGIARNRLYQFYQPKLYLPPAERKPATESDRILVNIGGTLPPTPAPAASIAGTGVTVLAQVSAHAHSQVAPAPPPETFSAYGKKDGETSGVIAMLGIIMNDLDKEMTTAETEEKEAQADYEQMMTDSAAKRAADSKSLAGKESAKADTQAVLEAHKEDKAAASKELAGTLETIHALHLECDWLLQYFGVRKEARAGEIDSLTNAKAVLSGADYSLIQARSRSLRGQA